MKIYIAQVLLIDKYGHRMEFLCTPGTHKEKIARIARERTLIETKVRFIEKLPQSVWSYNDIEKFN